MSTRAMSTIRRWHNLLPKLPQPVIVRDWYEIPSITSLTMDTAPLWDCHRWAVPALRQSVLNTADSGGHGDLENVYLLEMSQYNPMSPKNRRLRGLINYLGLDSTLATHLKYHQPNGFVQKYELSF